MVMTYLPFEIYRELANSLFHENEISGYLTYSRDESESRHVDAVYKLAEGEPLTRRGHKSVVAAEALRDKIPSKHRRRIIYFHSHPRVGLKHRPVMYKSYQRRLLNYFIDKFRSANDEKVTNKYRGIANRFLEGIGLRGEYLELLVAWDVSKARARLSLVDKYMQPQPIKILHSRKGLERPMGIK